MTSRARCARCGRDLERVKNCGGFYKSVEVWLAVRARGFYKGGANFGFLRASKINFKIWAFLLAD